jgi:hypothetical protein
MFIPAGGSPLQNLTATCQMTEIYSGDANRQSESTMLDTVTPETVSSDGSAVDSEEQAIATAITLFTNSQAQTIYAGPWNENAVPPLTLSGAITPFSGTAALASAEEWQVEQSDNILLPGAGSVFVTLAVVATLAAFRRTSKKGRDPEAPPRTELHVRQGEIVDWQHTPCATWDSPAGNWSPSSRQANRNSA